MYLIQPFVLLFMLLRSLKAPNYRKRLGERYGIYANLAKPTQDGIVIHAASVGEVIAATPLVNVFRRTIRIYRSHLQRSRQQALNA